MKKQYTNPKELSTPRFYTHAVSAEGPGKLVYVSGQVSWDAGGNVVGKGDMRAQSEQVFRNVGVALKAAGAAGRRDQDERLHGRPERRARSGLPRGAPALPQGRRAAGEHAGRRRSLVDPELLLEVEVVRSI